MAPYPQYVRHAKETLLELLLSCKDVGTASKWHIVASNFSFYENGSNHSDKNIILFNRHCQTVHWDNGHRLLCGRNRRYIGIPFVFTLPASQATYRQICVMCDDFARYTAPNLSV